MDKGEKQKIYGVTELTRLIKSTLEGRFGSVWLEGEVSNLRRPSSGHMYFTIKDESAQISGVMFRGSQRGLAFQPKDGLLVRVQGEITVYERGGNYQVIIRRMEEAGKGALQERFEKLKAKLHAEGLFATERKRPIPMLPRRIGVVTSPTGAAIRDILNVVTRRFPNLHVIVAPARVQGDGAAAEIAEGIARLNRFGGLDAMIIGRGGGSLEDLWCFNEEVVARAIAASTVPVISAVGHEIDFTISDFVADLRAPTPSAAAELVVGCKDAFVERLGVLGERLSGSLRHAALVARNRVLVLSGRPVFTEPASLVKQYQQRLDTAELRMAHQLQKGAREGRQGLERAGLQMAHELQKSVRGGRQNLQDAQVRMQHAVQMRRRTGGEVVERLKTQLRALNPLAVLDRGYSITSDEQGRIVRTATDVSDGQVVATRLGKGSFESKVTRVREEEK